MAHHLVWRTVQVEVSDCWATPCLCDLSLSYVGATREESRAAARLHVARAMAEQQRAEAEPQDGGSAP